MTLDLRAFVRMGFDTALAYGVTGTAVMTRIQSGGNITQTVRAAEMKASELRDRGGAWETASVALFIEATKPDGTALTFTPRANDVIRWGGDDVSVTIVEPIRPDGVTAIGYEIAGGG